MELQNLVRSLALGFQYPRSLVEQVARIYSFVEAFSISLSACKSNKIKLFTDLIRQDYIYYAINTARAYRPEKRSRWEGESNPRWFRARKLPCHLAIPPL